MLRVSGSSPHTRRYFHAVACFGGELDLFSAHAEVFPVTVPLPVWGLSLLRTRGGISG
ncbi:hypothetical protein cgR_6046 [Corynebacterium glutamicum R]|uniref:Uncharacterized protein n=1 Tax=Corynebacterium glutamicum (strain R) TaxID=340322 RepID=A0AB72VF66_CORGB|nr:hypothetical protein cgR_6046 [Corynebacterium glutamicum R]